MNVTFLRLPLLAGLTCLTCFTGFSALAQQEDELKRKAAEVERLKQELERAQQELKTMKSENDRLRSEKAQAVTAAKQAGVAVPIKPVKPLADVPPVSPTETLDARDVALYYQSDAATAAQRFTRQTFRVKGTVDGFETVMFQSKYRVLLETADKSVKVICTFSNPDGVNAVVPRGHGTSLVAVTSRGERPMMKTQEVITVQGRCLGLDGSVLHFDHCQVVK
jgi:hypothetical protein